MPGQDGQVPENLDVLRGYGYREAMSGGEPGRGERGRFAAGLALLGVAALATGSCSLVLDFSARDDAGPEDSGVFDANEAACSMFEPNDDLAEASQIDPGTYTLGICEGGDEDYFRIDLAEQQDLVVEIRFDTSGDGGDLDLRLYRASDGMVVDSSSTFADFERIEHTAAMQNQLPAGGYIIEVSGQVGTEVNTYTLELSITEGAPADAGAIDGGADAGL